MLVSFVHKNSFAFIYLFSIVQNSQLESDICTFAINVTLNLSSVSCMLTTSFHSESWMFIFLWSFF